MNMRKQLKKAAAYVLSCTMVAGLMSSMGQIVTVKAANLFSNVSWTHYHESWEQWDAVIAGTEVDETDTGFTANVTITGWQGIWNQPVDYPDGIKAGNYWGDLPYQLYSEAKVPVEAGKTYDISFTVKNEMTAEDGTTPTEKNITITVDSGIEGDTDNTFVFETKRIPANGTLNYSKTITIPADYTSHSVDFQIAYGHYGYSYNAELNGLTAQVRNNPYCLAPGTTEGVNCKGKLIFSNMDFEGDYVELPTEEGGETANKTSFPSGYTARDLVWADEFSGKTVKSDNWAYEVGNGDWGWGNQEAEYYTARSSNVYIADITDNKSIDNKALAIKAMRDDIGGCQYSSGRVKTAGKQQFKYGYYEARIKMDNGMAQGIWPAFWMLGTNGTWPGCGEYDIMEHVNAENYVNSTLHWQANDGNHAYNGGVKGFPTGDMNTWHKYAMEWDADKITFYLDGIRVYSQNYSADTSELFNSPAYFILNVAVGGNYIGNVLPSSGWNNSIMYVDYVRVFQKADTAGASYSGSWTKDPFWANYDYDNDQGGDDDEPIVEKEPVNGFNGWVHVHDPYEQNDAAIANTSVTDLQTGFSANVSMTGWQRIWGDGQYAVGGAIGDLPYQLTSTSTVNVDPGKTYQLGFDITNKMKNETGSPTEKNVTITVNSGIEGDYDNTWVFDTITIPANEEYNYTTSFTVPEEYAQSTVSVQMAYGCYAYSYAVEEAGKTSQMKSNPNLLAPGTTENINAKGRLIVKNAYCVTEGTEIEREPQAESSLYVNNWTHTHDPFEQNDAVISNTSIDESDTGFLADVSITGWQRYWQAPSDYPNAIEVGGGYGDNPYQLNSAAEIKVEAGKTYTLSFDIVNKMYAESGALTEKNVTISLNSGIDGDTDNNFVYETVRVPKSGTIHFEKEVTIPETYTNDTVSLILAYGCYMYSYEAQAAGKTDLVSDNPYLLAPGTTEGVNCTGKLEFKDVMFAPDVTAPVLEINGFQINPNSDGFRTTYSVQDASDAVKKVGLVYALKDYADEADMIVGSKASDVYSFEATSKGLLSASVSSLDGAKSYAMTMEYNSVSNEFLTANIMVRPYAVLNDGSVVYGDVVNTTVYNIASDLYTKKKMPTKAMHDYLYNRILAPCGFGSAINY